MTLLSRRQLLSTSLLAASASPLSWPGNALAQQDKLTRMEVGFPPGGGTDVGARSIAEGMRGRYPGGLIVENRPGAAARLAVEYVKAAAPDGRTMLFTPDFTMTIYPHSYKKLSYDPVKDFTPVAACARTCLAFSVGPAVPESVKTPVAFIAWAKEHPSQAAFASTSPGATPHFAGLMFSKAANLQLLHVPYKGGAPALQDLMGGQIASSFNPIGEAIPQLSSGRIRILALTSAQRNPFLPDVPTFRELGYQDVVAESWLGIMMPAKVPADILAQASAGINEAVAMPSVKDTYAKFGMEAVQSTPTQVAAMIKADIAKWGPIIKASGFTADD